MSIGTIVAARTGFFFGWWVVFASAAIVLSAAPAPPRAGDEGMTVRQSLASSAFWRLAIAVALGSVGAMAIIVHQIPFFTSSVGRPGGCWPRLTLPGADHVTVSGAPSSQRGQAVSS